MDNRIKWIKRPTFQLINDGEYKNFICCEYGIVLLDGKEIYFPTGWITDITSTPRLLYSIVPQIGHHSPAAILHDRLLELGSRKEARKWMGIQLEELENVSIIRRWLMCSGVWLWDNIRHGLIFKKGC